MGDSDPDVRYLLLGHCLSMFGQKGDNEISPVFLSMLDHAPDKQAFLGDAWSRFPSRGWSGSLADILVRRNTQVLKLANHSDAQVRTWVADIRPELDRWIERDRAREESF